jgi:hypothetical protein
VASQIQRAVLVSNVTRCVGCGFHEERLPARHTRFGQRTEEQFVLFNRKKFHGWSDDYGSVLCAISAQVSEKLSSLFWVALRRKQLQRIKVNRLQVLMNTDGDQKESSEEEADEGSAIGFHGESASLCALTLLHCGAAHHAVSSSSRATKN